MSELETGYFHTQALAPGVWAVISSDPVWMMANAGIVDLGDRALVWDTGSSPVVARALRQVAEALTGKMVSMLALSHQHLDHTLGIQEFRDTPIVSAATTRILLQGRFERLLNEGRTISADKLGLRQHLQRVNDPHHRRALEGDLAELEMLEHVLENFRPIFPSITFERRLELHGQDRSAELLNFGEGHTLLDTVLWLPKEGILFTGDLVLVEHIGFIGHGNPEAWLERLTDLKALPGLRQLVPGHGPVSGPEAIQAMKIQLTTMVGLGQSLRSVDDLDHVPVPFAWQEWGLPSSFRANLRFLLERKG